MVEIGVISRFGANEVTRISQMVDPGRPIPPVVQQIHGISEGDVAGQPSFADIAAQVAELADGAWIVGHNVCFDVGFLAMELALVGSCPAPRGCLDSRMLAAA